MTEGVGDTVKLNELSEQGWELVTAVPYQVMGGTWNIIFYLKKLKTTHGRANKS